MLALALLVCLQETVVFAEDFQAPPLRDAIHPGWERIVDDDHSLYNAAGVVAGAMRLSTLGGPTEIRHVGIAVDADHSYRLTADVRLTGARANSPRLALRWLDRRGVLLREDASTSAPVIVEEPPSDAASVRLILAYAGPDVRGRVDFDHVRLWSWPRVHVEPMGRIRPVFSATERPRFVIDVPAWRKREIAWRLRLLDADGADVRLLERGDEAFSTSPLPHAVYRLVAEASLPDGARTGRELWIRSIGRPLFDPPDPAFGLWIRPGAQDPAGLCDAAGVRHTAMDLHPEAEALLESLALRLDTRVTVRATDAVDRKTIARLRPFVDRWAAPGRALTSEWVATRLDVLSPRTVEALLDDGLARAGAEVFFAAEEPPLTAALWTLNDLLGGAERIASPGWAPGMPAFRKRGRTIVALRHVEVTPPADFTIVVDPLLGIRAREGGPVSAGPRAIFAVSK